MASLAVFLSSPWVPPMRQNIICCWRMTWVIWMRPSYQRLDNQIVEVKKMLTSFL